MTSSNGCIFSAGADQIIIQWRISDGAEIRRFVENTIGATIHNLQVDGDFLYGATGRFVRKWNIATGDLVASFEHDQGFTVIHCRVFK